MTSICVSILFYFILFVFLFSYSPAPKIHGLTADGLGLDWRRNRVRSLVHSFFTPHHLSHAGSRYNIEAMGEIVDVERFFDHVYLVDLSPSLCEVARKRFERLGWRNVSVVCQDARAFRLDATDSKSSGADLVTMSYSLSMIPGKRWWWW
jgi:hypothetical protein